MNERVLRKVLQASFASSLEIDLFMGIIPRSFSATSPLCRYVDICNADTICWLLRIVSFTGALVSTVHPISRFSKFIRFFVRCIMHAALSVTAYNRKFFQLAINFAEILNFQRSRCIRTHVTEL